MGDALVAARHLYQQGMKLIYFPFPPEEWPGLVRKIGNFKGPRD